MWFFKNHLSITIPEQIAVVRVLCYVHYRFSQIVLDLTDILRLCQINI